MPERLSRAVGISRTLGSRIVKLKQLTRTRRLGTSTEANGYRLSRRWSIASLGNG